MTTIEYSLAEDGFVEISIYNDINQKIRELVTEYKPAGMHTVIWDGRDEDGRMVSSGVYFSRISMGDHTASGRMLLLR
jgi:flagellar hook assembly protein FlgD